MFSDNHRRYLATTLRHIEREVDESIAQLRGDDKDALFRHYRHFPPQERIDTLMAHMARLRAVMRRFMDTYQIDYQHDDLIEASWNFETRLALIRNAVYELRPRNLRGYGEISTEDEQACRALSAELAMLLKTMGSELRREPLRLPTGTDDAPLAALAEIIERHRLFEYRSRLEALLAREQGDRMEVALLGRVSSGKSSLVNALLGHPLLPVGAVPVTTVVTRIRYGETLDIRAMDVEGVMETVAPENLRSYVDEAGNPGNRRRLREVSIHFPAPILQDGIVLADTPGLGSLHTHASAHALDYLPRCDMGIVAIDAAATLMPQDLDIVRALRDAGAHWLVVLTKADTVAGSALEQQREYVTQVLGEALQKPITVCAVSVEPEHRAALKTWLDNAFRKNLREAAEQAGIRHRHRVLDLANRVRTTLQQAIAEQPASAFVNDAPAVHADILADLEEVQPALHSLIRRLAERGPEVIIEEMATQTPAGVTLTEKDLSDRAAALADAVVRDVLDELRRVTRDMDPDTVAQVLRGVPPFAAALPNKFCVSAGSGPRLWRRPLLRRHLQRVLDDRLTQSFDGYANELNHWLDQSVLQLRHHAMESADAPLSERQTDIHVLQADLERLVTWLGEPDPRASASISQRPG
ncbi:dynamin family protein [Dyella jejuensis]|uniref:Dynamin family protein n=1 Tax=Dyella jejuensis TaxID=1432009 RepID=A0ABW8JIW7_9GAMM